MGKTNGNGNGTASSTQPAVHLVLQGKGGIEWRSPSVAFDARTTRRRISEYATASVCQLGWMSRAESHSGARSRAATTT